MKVLLINASPHEKGSTYTALSQMLTVFEEQGIETTLMNIGKKAIRGCIACGYCTEHGKCVFDDEVNRAAEEFEKSNGIVLASPVYYASANATLCAFCDRLFHSSPFDKTMKVGAAVVSARRGGCTAAFDQINKYFSISSMPIASSRYWNQIHGNNAEEALQDKEGLGTMRTLARNMAFLMKSIELGKNAFGIPESEEIIKTNFIR